MTPEESNRLLDELGNCYSSNYRSLLTRASAYGGRDNAKDALHNAMEVASRKIAEFPGKGVSMNVWLCGLVQTAALDDRRKQSRRSTTLMLANDLHRVGDESSGELAESTPSDCLPPDEIVANNEESRSHAEILADALRYLAQEDSTGHAIIIRLYSEDQPSGVGLAREMGITPFNLRKHHSRAVKRLTYICRSLPTR